MFYKDSKDKILLLKELLFQLQEFKIINNSQIQFNKKCIILNFLQKVEKEVLLNIMEGKLEIYKNHQIFILPLLLKGLIIKIQLLWQLQKLSQEVNYSINIQTTEKLEEFKKIFQINMLILIMFKHFLLTIATAVFSVLKYQDQLLM